MIGLLIVYEHGGKALALTRVDDSELLRMAARRAIEARRAEVTRAAALDSNLRRIAEHDCQCLEEKLSQLVPGLIIEAPSTRS